MSLEQPDVQDSATDAPADDAQDESLLDQAEGDEGGEPPEEDEEVEIGDKKFALPKSAAEKLKSERMLQSDYTRKTQEVAEQRRAVEAFQQQANREAEAHRQDLHEYATLVSIDQRISQFANVDWNQLSAENPALAQQSWIEFSQLKDARNNIAGTLTQRQQQRQFEQQQATAKRIEEGQAVLARDIKDWSPDLAAKLRAFAASDGWSPAEIEAITPAQVKSLHRSYIGAQLLQKQTPAAKAAVPATPAVKVGSNATVRKDPSKMTDSEFAAWRRQQVKNRK